MNYKNTLHQELESQLEQASAHTYDNCPNDDDSKIIKFKNIFRKSSLWYFEIEWGINRIFYKEGNSKKGGKNLSSKNRQIWCLRFLKLRGKFKTINRWL